MGVQLPGALLCSQESERRETLGGQLDRPQIEALPILLPDRGATLPLLPSGRSCPLIPHTIRRRTHFSLQR